jgi:hypothetical protein
MPEQIADAAQDGVTARQVRAVTPSGLRISELITDY